jgi:hypothetical protein
MLSSVLISLLPAGLNATSIHLSLGVLLRCPRLESANVALFLVATSRSNAQSAATARRKIPSVQRPPKALLASDGCVMPDSSREDINIIRHRASEALAGMAHCGASETALHWRLKKQDKAGQDRKSKEKAGRKKAGRKKAEQTRVTLKPNRPSKTHLKAGKPKSQEDSFGVTRSRPRRSRVFESDAGVK